MSLPRRRAAAGGRARAAISRPGSRHVAVERLGAFEIGDAQHDMVEPAIAIADISLS